MNNKDLLSQIKKLKKSNQQLKKENSGLKSVLNSINHAIIYTDLEGVIVYMNKAAENLTGYTKEISRGKYLDSIFKFINNHNEKPVINLIDEIIKEKKIEKNTNEGILISKNGDKNLIRISGSKINYNQNKNKSILIEFRKSKNKYINQRKLHKYGKRYRQIFNKANDAIYIHNLTDQGMPGNFIEVNPKACEMLGYSKKEFGKMTPLDIDPTDSGARLPGIMQNLLKKGHHTFEMKHRTKNKKIIPVEISSHLFSLNNKKLILSIARDISKRKQAENKLRISQERLSVIYESSPVSITLSSFDTGKFVKVNPAFTEITGWKREEAIDKTAFELGIWGEQPEKRREKLLNKLKNNNSVKDLKLRFYDRHKNEIIGLISAKIVYVSGKKFILSIVIDITDKKRSEKKCQYIWEEAKDGMLLTNNKGKVIKVNQALCKMVELNRQELEGNPFTAFYKNNKTEILEQYITRFQNKNIPKKMEKKVRLHNGQFRWFEIVNSVLDIPGNPKQVLGIFRDITKRKKMINRIRLTNRELASINNLALEINNTLNLNKVLNTALKEIISILDADGGIIYTSKGNEEKYLPRMHINISQSIIEEINYITKDHFIAGQIIKNGRPKVVQNLSQHTENVPATALEEGWRSYAGIPIIIDKEIIGAISIVDHELGHFDYLDINILIRIGLIVGMAIKNARLHIGLKDIIKEQQKKEKQLHSLITHITGLEENYRKKAARKIHDEIGQKLTALSFNLTNLKQNIENKECQLRINDSINLLKDTLKDTNNILKELTPQILYEQGLYKSILWYIEQVKYRTNLIVNFEGEELSQKLSDNFRINIYRIFQEILHNITKHANAKKVEIYLKENNDHLSLEVKDDGIGFEPEKIKQKENLKNFGIRGMQERINSLGGTLKINSSPGMGTQVNIKIKLNKSIVI